MWHYRCNVKNRRWKKMSKQGKLMWTNNIAHRIASPYTHSQWTWMNRICAFILSWCERWNLIVCRHLMCVLCTHAHHLLKQFTKFALFNTFLSSFCPCTIFFRSAWLFCLFFHKFQWKFSWEKKKHARTHIIECHAWLQKIKKIKQSYFQS